MVLEDPLAIRVLTYLADHYRPVMSDWVDVSEVAHALAVPESDVDIRCQRLLAQGLVETSAPDEENESSAALITVKGLLAIGRVP